MVFEKGQTPIDVATITGHEDPVMLMRYPHLRAADLTNKLGSAHTVVIITLAIPCLMLAIGQRNMSGNVVAEAHEFLKP